MKPSAFLFVPNFSLSRRNKCCNIKNEINKKNNAFVVLVYVATALS